MTTAVVSDLHLGTRSGQDLLRDTDVLRKLLAELEGVDQVVLLGDVLELRGAPLAGVLDAGRPLFEGLGEALGGGRCVIVPGNHDHQLAAPVLDGRRAGGNAKPLPLERIARPGRSEPLGKLARRMGRTELVVAYPGVWIRPDVYATHGHYLDCHMTVPKLECLAAAAMQRIVGRLPEDGRTPDDYESALAPLYALTYRVGQAVTPAQRVFGTGWSAMVWQRANDRGGGRGLDARLLGGVLLPAAVAAVNLTGLGPFSADLSAGELHRAGLRAMTEVVGGLGIEAPHVIFGHTHRPGPLEGEDAWTVPGGGRLLNTGSWVHEPVLLGDAPAESPYRPGTCALIDDDGPPRLLRVLDEIPPIREE